MNHYRGVTGYLKLGGQVLMRRTAAVRRRLLFCQETGWAIAHPAHPPLTPLPYKDLAFIVQHICVTNSLFSLTQVKIMQNNRILRSKKIN